MTASLSPDPSTVDFRADGAWHRFTVTSSEHIKVVANPGTTPLRVEIHDQSITADYCPAERNDNRTIPNARSVYLAGCVAGTATVELRRSDDTVLRTYTFTISSATSTLPAPAAPSGLRRTSSGATSIGVSLELGIGCDKVRSGVQGRRREQLAVCVRQRDRYVLHYPRPQVRQGLRHSGEVIRERHDRAGAVEQSLRKARYCDICVPSRDRVAFSGPIDG